jgi:2-furoate---CoA ligase
MFDLGRTFLATVERSPDATAIADGERRLGYASWYEEIARLASGLTALGLRRGDRLAVILQNRLEMASLHWACQFAGIVATPLNWRIKPEELDYCLADAEAAAIVFDAVAADTVAGAAAAQRLPRIAIGEIDGATCRFVADKPLAPLAARGLGWGRPRLPKNVDACVIFLSHRFDSDEAARTAECLRSSTSSMMGPSTAWRCPSGSP